MVNLERVKVGMKLIGKATADHGDGCPGVLNVEVLWSEEYEIDPFIVVDRENSLGGGIIISTRDQARELIEHIRTAARSIDNFGEL